MKILFWLNIGFDRHGPSVHLLKDVIEESLKMGHEAVVILRNTDGPYGDIPEELAEYKGLTVEVIHEKQQIKSAFAKRFLEDILFFIKCRGILKKHKDIDSIFLQSCYLPLVPVLMNRLYFNRPMLINVQNIFPIDAGVLNIIPTKGISSLPYKFINVLQKKAYDMVNRIITISKDMEETLVKEGADREKIDVVYNWSYDDAPVTISNKDNHFLNVYPEHKSAFRVVFAGNMGLMVNPDIIAYAAEKLKVNDDIHFIVIGDGNNLNRLKNLAMNKNLTNMFFYGYQPEEFAKHNYAMADVNINALPSGIITTCLPSKTATMMNACRPMVVAVEKDSSYAGILQEVDKSIVVDCDDYQGFCEAILYFYNVGRGEYSYNSHDVFKKYFSQNNAKKYVNALLTMKR